MLHRSVAAKKAIRTMLLFLKEREDVLSSLVVRQKVIMHSRALDLKSGPKLCALVCAGCPRRLLYYRSKHKGNV